MLISEHRSAAVGDPAEGLAGATPEPGAWEVARARHALPPFRLPAPDQLSHSECLRHPADGDRRCFMAALATSVAEAGWQAPGTLLRLRAALSRLADSAEPSTAAIDSHDQYFHIVRIGGDPADAYLRAVVAALAVWLDEVADDQERQAHAAIGDALLELWLRALGQQALPGARHETLAPGPGTQQAVRRWLRGHHVFAVLTQGLIWALNRLASLGENAPADQVIDMLGLMTRLYRASAVAFRFTANFDPQVYSDVIRPSMSEPHVPPGFSGSMSVDHGHLVALLSRQRGLLAASGARFPGVYGQLREALSEVYDSHRHVCERFVSPEGPSLRTDRLCGDNAAVSMIDRFKERRLDMLR